MKPSQESVARTFVRGGFTLVELMVVIGLIALLTTLGIPAFQSMTRSASLATAGQIVKDELAYARQLAVTRNQAVEVRFYKKKGELASSQAEYRTIWTTIPGADLASLGKPQVLPNSVIIDPDSTYSNIELGTESTEASNQTGAIRDLKYRTVKFSPDGSAELVGSGTSIIFASIILASDKDKTFSNKPADDFVTVVVDGNTGAVRAIQPYVQ